MKWTKKIIRYEEVEGTLQEFLKKVIIEVRFFETRDDFGIVDIYADGNQRMVRQGALKVPINLLPQDPNDVTLGDIRHLVKKGKVTEEMFDKHI